MKHHIIMGIDRRYFLGHINLDIIIIGQADCVNEKVGIKLPLSNLQQSANDFSEAIEKLYTDADLLSYFSNNCHERQKELCWDNKTKQMLDLYKRALSLS